MCPSSSTAPRNPKIIPQGIDEDTMTIKRAPVHPKLEHLKKDEHKKRKEMAHIMSEKVAETEDEDTEFVRKVSDDENSKVLGSLEGLTEAKNESDRTTMIERVRKLITYNIGGDILHKTKKAAADKIREGATEGCESDSETLGVNRSLETEFKTVK
ncbi:hypothetical protein Pcinc_004264 [Petrolisthes cinctipes]|uniref:Uncharacterized protein n=1 Tax=Petrolisthes cinctipes TaxID=88211 RepID=A0AAE1GH84_PETCI|nr:hypothetical protein Pcinc_004264 [Petrolisthes cinctipes]